MLEIFASGNAAAATGGRERATSTTKRHRGASVHRRSASMDNGGADALAVSLEEWQGYAAIFETHAGGDGRRC